MSIGIKFAGKSGNIPAAVFLNALEGLLNVIRDIDSSVSQRSRGSSRWEISTLQKNSPAIVEIQGVTRLKTGDYTGTIQASVVDGLHQLVDNPEIPRYYSYSALKSARIVADQHKRLESISLYTGSESVQLDQRIVNNIDNLLGIGSRSLGSVRGSLDSLTVHSGYEFRVWKQGQAKPVTCRFRKADLPNVIANLRSEVEVFGELRRNNRGEAVLMTVREFQPLERQKLVPSVRELSGIVPDLYGGMTLKQYMSELRDE